MSQIKQRITKKNKKLRTHFQRNTESAKKTSYWDVIWIYFNEFDKKSFAPVKIAVL